jgi:hypothetical protein
MTETPHEPQLDSPLPDARLALLSPLRAVLALESAASNALLEAIELARYLLSDLAPVERGGAPLTPYFAHNAAALLVQLIELEAPAEVTVALGRAARPTLEAAFEADPNDLALLLALLHDALLNTPAAHAQKLLDRGKEALALPFAGDRLLATHARLVAHLCQARDTKLRAAASRYLEDALAELARYRSRQPNNEVVARTRIELLGLRVARLSGTSRDEAFREARTALHDYETRFGRTPELERLELRALVDRIVGEEKAPQAAVRDARERLLEGARPGGTSATELLHAFRALDRAQALSEADYRAFAEGLGQRIEGMPDAQAEPLRRARRRALSAAGDAAALLALAVDELQRNPRDRASAAEIAEHLLDAKRRQAPLPDVAPEVLRTAVQQLPATLLSSFGEEDALRWLELVEERLGAELACEHAVRGLLGTKELKRHAPLFARTAALQEQLGRRDDALATLEDAFKNNGHLDFRFEFAERLLHLGARLAEADAALKPLMASDPERAAKARGLRERIANHPEFLASRKQELLTFEERAGVGGRTPQRLRVVHQGDGFVLADMVDHRAPQAYGQPHLRVMIKRTDLPSYLDVSELKKGQDLFAPVVGEDEKPGKARSNLRVYWIAEGHQADPGWSDAEKEKRAAELEARFRLGTGASIPLRIVRVAAKAGSFWVRPEAAGPGGGFPGEIRAGAGDLPAGWKLDKLTAGMLVYAPVLSEKVSEKAPGERRFRVRGPVEIDEKSR